MRNPEKAEPMARRTSISISLSMAVMVLTLVVFAGIAIGRVTSSGFVSAAEGPDATATRQAELKELNRLRTQVAQTIVCTPPGSPTSPKALVPTVTPTPVPPAQMGETLTYAGDWTVVVTGLAAAPEPEIRPLGKFVQVSATITNNSAERRTFPFGDWVLLDATGRVFVVSDTATTQLYGPGWYLGIDPSLDSSFRVVFDVAVDAGSTFTLESKTDPIFRVAVQIQSLG
jgi:hypothetical protein